MNEKNNHNTLIAATHRFEDKLEEIDLVQYWDLREIMDALPNLHFKDGYTLDGCMVGDMRNAIMKLYGYRIDSENIYYPGEEHIRPSADIWFDESSQQCYGGNPPDIRTYEPPLPFKDGQVITGTITSAAFDTVPPLSDYIELQFTEEAIWEALLLIVESCSYLEHRWHGNYLNGRIIVDSASLIESCSSVMDPSALGLFLNIHDLAPRVRILSDEKALVSYYRWSEYRGMSKKAQLAYYNGKNIHFEERGAEEMAKYDDGIIL